MRRLLVLMMVASGLVVIPAGGAIAADTVTWVAEGQVVTPNVNGVTGCTPLSPGDQFQVEYTFDPTTPDTATTRSDLGAYAFDSAVVRVGGQTFVAGGQIVVRNNNQFGGAVDGFSVDSAFSWQDHTETALTSDALPASPPDPNGFSNSQIVFYGTGLNNRACIATATFTDHYVLLDIDADDDGVLDADDNCVNTPNPGQEDFDGDGIGDVCDDDVDGDTVANGNDICDGTVLPDEPTRGLKGPRFAAQEDGSFDSGLDRFDGRYTLADTYGCSGTQIIELDDLGVGHTKFGISKSALEAFIANNSNGV